jgi:hypothetical protein
LATKKTQTWLKKEFGLNHIITNKNIYFIQTKEEITLEEVLIKRRCTQIQNFRFSENNRQINRDRIL